MPTVGCKRPSFETVIVLVTVDHRKRKSLSNSQTAAPGVKPPVIRTQINCYNPGNMLNTYETFMPGFVIPDF